MTTTYQIQDNVAILTMDSPPVNSLSQATRKGLTDGIRRAIGDAAVHAVVVTGASNAFCAGAEISEFQSMTGEEAHTLPALLDQLEGASKPVVAAIHGFALGGGMEVALACHFRVADNSAVLGLPEVDLGLLPGAGGTQRLPRLIGAIPAAEFILSGKHVRAQHAVKAGLLDSVCQGDLLKFAISYAKDKAAASQTRMLSQEQVPGGLPAQELDALLRKVSKARRGEIAPKLIVDCVKAACTSTYAEGMKVEQRLFVKLLQSPESRALQHMFFAERACKKIPKALQAPSAPINRIGIVGSGTMGGGIAMSAVNAGINVVLLDVKQEFLDRGMRVIQGNYAFTVKRGRLSKEQMAKRMSLIKPTTSYADFGDCDMVIEAVFENMDVKRQVFKELDAHCRPDAILCSNTSGLDVDEIASTIRDPTRFVGTHFFSPANIMKLLENVYAKQSSPRAVSTAMTLGKKLGKIPVLVGNCPGFVGNRMLEPYSEEARNLVLEGATPQQVDTAVRKFGMNMGPFAMQDLVGLDLFWRKRKSEGTDNPELCIEDALCEMKRFGQKSAHGFYKYKKGSRAPVVDPTTEALIRQIAQNRGIAQKAGGFSESEIMERLLFPMINEGFKILEEGIANKVSDIDVVYCYGYGFPRFRGGPMRHAHEIGLDVVLAGLKKNEHLGAYWVPSAMLVRCVQQDKTGQQMLDQGGATARSKL